MVRGYCPPPQCASCRLQAETVGTPAHLASKLCRDLTKQRQQNAVVAAGAQVLEQTFTAYDAKLRRVRQFKYLGQILAMDNNDLPAMCRNLKEAM